MLMPYLGAGKYSDIHLHPKHWKVNPGPDALVKST